MANIQFAQDRKNVCSIKIFPQLVLRYRMFFLLKSGQEHTHKEITNDTYKENAVLVWLKSLRKMMYGIILTMVYGV